MVLAALILMDLCSDSVDVPLWTWLVLIFIYVVWE